MELDREALFQLLAKKDWDRIAKILYQNAKQVRNTSDPIMQQAIGYFEAEFFSYTGALEPQLRAKKYENTHLIIELGQHGFSKSFVHRFVEERLALLKLVNSPNLLDYAKGYQNHPAARAVIAEYQQKRPEQVAAIKREHHAIRTTEVNQSVAPKITKLFKSKQEENFFEAVRRIFPTYHPYPNVAVSCVLDFEAIRDQLTPEQRDYYFKAIVDAVVFDGRRDYEPRYFIELDSIHHDDRRAAINDGMKDAIFRAANVKLIRIRPLNKQAASVEEFEKLVEEVMRPS